MTKRSREEWEKTLFVSDLDGTLLNVHDAVSPETVRIINGLAERGMHFTYATARSYESASRVSRGLTERLPVIVNNGTFIMDGSTGNRLLKLEFTPQQQRFVRNLLERHGVFALVYGFVDGRERVSWLTQHENEWMRYYLDNRKGDRRLRPVTEPGELYRGDAFYFTCIGTPEELRPVWEEVRENPEFTCTFQQELYRTEYWLELMPREATKANAARKLCALLGCDRLVAFGDAVNDLPLFEAADEAYAVGNAVEPVRNAATGVIGDNGSDGVARWLLARARECGVDLAGEA